RKELSDRVSHAPCSVRTESIPAEGNGRPAGTGRLVRSAGRMDPTGRLRRVPVADPPPPELAAPRIWAAASRGDDDRRLSGHVLSAPGPQSRPDRPALVRAVCAPSRPGALADLRPAPRLDDGPGEQIHKAG